MTENSTGAISLSEAVERVTAQAGADDETVETQEARRDWQQRPLKRTRLKRRPKPRARTTRIATLSMRLTRPRASVG